MINLPDVTLVALSSIEIPATIKAIEKSCEGIDFGAVKLLSHEKPDDLPSNIAFEKVPKINNIDDFNLYAFKYLGTHVDTSHCLRFNGMVGSQIRHAGQMSFLNFRILVLRGQLETMLILRGVQKR
jgi:hypothetical protein